MFVSQHQMKVPQVEREEYFKSDSHLEGSSVSLTNLTT